MPQHPFGEALRRRRQQADLTIELLAEASGVSSRTISDIERGMSVGPQRRTVVALADALGLADRERSDFLSSARPGRRGAAIETASASVRPFRLPDFVGRDAEMDLLASVLSPSPSAGMAPVLISGTAGIGKTTVALEALHRSADDSSDILFVNVHSPDALPLSPLQVLQALLRQTGVADEPGTMDEAVAAWRRVSATRSLAVLLDNTTTEAQVRAVLTATRPVRVVLTSRRSLTGLEGCRRVVLGALARPASIALLSRIIPAAQRVSGDVGELAELCSDLPLALRIAGNRISSRPAWTVEDFAKRLRAHETRLRQLVAGDLRVEATFALSYESLTPRSQQVFRSIPLITGSSFRADMVAAIHAFDEETTADILDELTDLALLEPLSGDRYRIHDLLRIFAEARLTATQSTSDIYALRDRLRRWTLDTARSMALVREEQDAAAGPGDPTLASAREWLRAESDTWLEALKVSAATPADSLVAVLETAKALLRFAERWLSFAHWRTVAGIGVAAAEEVGDPAALAEQLHWMAAVELAQFDGDADVARAAALRARTIAQTADSGKTATWALVSITWSEVRRGEFDAALQAGRQGLEESLAQRDIEAQIQFRYWMAMALIQDDPDGALLQARETRKTLDENENTLALREWNNAINLATALSAKVLLRLERYSEAVDVANQIMDNASFFRHESDFLARGYRHRGFAYLGLGELDRAREDLRRALDLVEEHERPDWWAAEIQDALDSLDQP